MFSTCHFTQHHGSGESHMVHLVRQQKPARLVGDFTDQLVNHPLPIRQQIPAHLILQITWSIAHCLLYVVYCTTTDTGVLGLRCCRSAVCTIPLAHWQWAIAYCPFTLLIGHCLLHGNNSWSLNR